MQMKGAADMTVLLFRSEGFNYHKGSLPVSVYYKIRLLVRKKGLF